MIRVHVGQYERKTDLWIQFAENCNLNRAISRKTSCKSLRETFDKLIDHWKNPYKLDALQSGVSGKGPTEREELVARMLT